MSGPKEYKFNILIKREQYRTDGSIEERWVARCLQYDIVAQADGLQKLVDNLVTTLKNQFVLALQYKQDPFFNMKPSPNEVWEQYDGGIILGENLPISIAPDALPKALAEFARCVPRGEASFKIAA